jgi:hypothetical protein
MGTELCEGGTIAESYVCISAGRKTVTISVKSRLSFLFVNQQNIKQGNNHKHTENECTYSITQNKFLDVLAISIF